ncbi:MAG: DUF58 domain-containing protein [Thiotrichaceae bacterium]|nr:DUF58 domain-containing protein [Thiotrichaceae bacterium]
MKYLPPLIENIATRLFNVERRSGNARSHSIMLTQRRIYILPTYYGILFAMLLMLLLVGATNYNNSLGFVLTFLLASIGLVSIIHTYRNLLKLNISAGKASAVFCGSMATFHLQLENPDKRPRYNICTRFKGASPTTIDINNNEMVEIKLTCGTTQRGWLSMGKVTIDSVFPLGFLRAWSHVTLSKSCLVYPLPATEPLAPISNGGGSGKESSQSGGDDFIGYRDYQPGDSPRHVNWKAAAHSNKLHTKRFGDNESSERWFEWDSLPTLDTESRLRQLCRWIIDAEQNGEAYGLHMPETTIPPGLGDDHQHRCLERLALYPSG